MENVRSWCGGQPSDRARLKNRTDGHAGCRYKIRLKLEFHDADTDTDTDILARIFSDTSDERFPEVIPMASSTTRRHSRDDPREDVGEDVGVSVGVVECQLKPIEMSLGAQSLVSPMNEPCIRWSCSGRQHDLTIHALCSSAMRPIATMTLATCL